MLERFQLFLFQVVSFEDAEVVFWGFLIMVVVDGPEEILSDVRAQEFESRRSYNTLPIDEEWVYLWSVPVELKRDAWAYFDQLVSVGQKIHDPLTNGCGES